MATEFGIREVTDIRKRAPANWTRTPRVLETAWVTEEREATLAFLNKEAALHRTRINSKNAQGSPLSAPADIDAARGAAVVDLCHALFNLNEFMYID